MSRTSRSSLRGAAAIVGIGQTPYFKRGTSHTPELKLALQAIVAACADAGIETSEIDGFVSYGSERNDGQRMIPALGIRDLRFGGLAWSHGGGIPGALGLAACAIHSGQADVVVVHRAMSEFDSPRVSTVVAQDDTAAQYLVNGVEGPAQICAMRAQRMIEHDGVPREALRVMAQASYHHARSNPGASSRGKELDDATYDDSRWISEPYRLYDCSRENDAAVAVVMVSAERAADLPQVPAFVLSAPMGCAGTWGAVEENHAPYVSSGFESVARRLWSESGYTAADVDVAQIYENFTGQGIAALVDHGFCTLEEVADFVRLENLVAPSGRLPINTSGGNLAEGFIHGMGLVTEAVRQIRGSSVNQVPGAALSLMTGGPGDAFVSSVLLGSGEAL